MTIISPIWFYLIGLLENLGTILGVITLVLSGVSLLFFVIGGIAYLDAYSENNKIMAKAISQKGKKPLILALISATLYCTIPSKETMYTMMVANVVTYENVEIATDAIKDSVDYIMDKLDSDDDKDKQKEDTKDTNEDGEI